MSALTDLIYSGSNAVAGLTEGAVNDAIAKYGEDKKVSFGDTAYFLPTIYAATGVKVSRLGDLPACVGVLKSLITNSALSLFECFPQISPHDSDFVAVFVNVRAVFAMIGSLALYPAEARHIDFITGLQFFRRLGRSWLWCGILSECLPRGRLEFRSYGCFLNRVATWPHSGTQGDTGGNQGHYDEFLHFSSSLDAKRASNPIAVRQETERSFS